MNTGDWMYAHLSDEQLKMVSEAEQTLGKNVKYVLAYAPDHGIANDGMDIPQAGLHVAVLNPSQVECLQGLESRLNTVLVAYR